MNPDSDELIHSRDDASATDDFAGMPFKSWPQVYGFVLGTLVLLVTLFWLLGEFFS